MPTIVRFRYDGKFGRAARGSNRVVREELERLGDEQLVPWIKDRTPEFTGESKARTRSEVTGVSTRQVLRVLSDAPQSLFSQQTGRKPGGKQPPPENMLEWVRRKGLRLDTPRRPQQRRRVSRRPNTLRLSKEAARELEKRRRELRRSQERLVSNRLLREQKQIAFLIGRAIKRRGIRGLRLYTRVLFSKRGAIVSALARINRRIADMINR